MRDQASGNKKWTRCALDHCGRPAISWLDSEFFCLDHFISYCYRRLDECGSLPFGEPDEAVSEANDCFLQECIQQSAEMVRPIRGFDNLDRARLFDIFLWASELAARRSVFRPRKLASSHANDKRFTPRPENAERA